MRNIKSFGIPALLFILFLFASCDEYGPETIQYNKEECDQCRMTISDRRFGCELVTLKGRTYKFDDLSCMMDFTKQNQDKCKGAGLYLSDYISPNNLMLSERFTLVKGDEVGSPMGGNIAAFTSADSARFYLTLWKAEMKDWSSIESNK